MASRPAVGLDLSLVAIALLVATGLSTLLPWTVGADGSVSGVRHDDAFLVIVASVAGVVLHRMGAKPAWIAPGFAAVVQIRDIAQVRDAGFDVGVGLWIGLVTSAAAVTVLVADLLQTIRAQRLLEDQPGDL